jgi:hypothetical protein
VPSGMLLVDKAVIDFTVSFVIRSAGLFP